MGLTYLRNMFHGVYTEEVTLRKQLVCILAPPPGLEARGALPREQHPNHLGRVPEKCLHIGEAIEADLIKYQLEVAQALR